MRSVLTCVLAAIILALVPLTSVLGQEFPSKPVRFVVPYAAGGSGDLLARLLGTKLSSMWGQQVVVDNKPGAGGLIGTEFAARSDPDGYTLYLATDGPLTIAATLNKHVPYDWKRDLAPVSMIAVGYQVLIVDPKLPVRNLREFVELARQKPGALNFASIGVGSAPISPPNCSSRWRMSISPTFRTAVFRSGHHGVDCWRCRHVHGRDIDRGAPHPEWQCPCARGDFRQASGQLAGHPDLRRGWTARR